jgi:hypothetical protein
MCSKSPDHDAPSALSEATPPAKDWVALFFARANPNAEFEAASAMAEAAGRTLDVSAALAIAGRTIDLGGLDNWIGRLTASCLDLEPVDGRRIRPILAGLLRRLDKLEQVVTAAQTEPVSGKHSQNSAKSM